MAADDLDRDEIARDFAQAVNMAPAELERWLETDDSKSVGMEHESEHEAVGHKSGHRIVAIKRKKKADHTDDDFAYMRKVVGYVHRHLKQGAPKKDAEHSRWRYSLMNWVTIPRRIERASQPRAPHPPPPRPNPPRAFRAPSQS